MSLFLVFLAIALLGAAGLLGAGLASKSAFRRRTANSPTANDGRVPFEDGFDEPVASLPPVLLPAAAAPADIDGLRFGLGLRGYRMDQVDQVLDELRDQLAAKDREIARLQGDVARLGRPAEQ